jgi:hypothetical protein
MFPIRHGTFQIHHHILALGLIGDTIVVVGSGNIVTWHIPTGEYDLNVRVNVNDSVRTTAFDYTRPSFHMPSTCILISPDLNYVALARPGCDEDISSLAIYDTSTGELVTTTVTVGCIICRGSLRTGTMCGVYCAVVGTRKGGKSPMLSNWSPSDQMRTPREGSPGSPVMATRSHPIGGYGTRGKALLWLPRRWRSDGGQMKVR